MKRTAPSSLHVFLLFLFFWMSSHQTFAALQKGKSWSALNYQNYITKDKKWTILLHNQIRLITRSHPLAALLTENSIGYTLNKKQRTWLGFTVLQHDLYQQSREREEYRLFQELYWKLIDNSKTRFAYRTRFEEIWFSREKQESTVFRQMFAYEAIKLYYGQANPLIYDELFVNLNNTSYTSIQALAQNRLFVGFNIYSKSKKSFWKVGYMNQYIAHDRKHVGEDNHLLVVTYTFGAPEISLPIDS